MKAYHFCSIEKNGKVYLLDQPTTICAVYIKPCIDNLCLERVDVFPFFQAGCRFKPTFIHIMYEAPQTMFLWPGPVLKLLRGRLATGGLSRKDETNLNSFKSALTLSETGMD